jgi:hypothetical protein
MITALLTVGDWLSDHTEWVRPIILGILAFIASNAWATWGTRKRQSRLGAAVCAALIEELQNGIKLMEAVLISQAPYSQLPQKSWNGMTTISDEVLDRLLSLSEGKPNPGFPIDDIRIHLKNYFDHICINFSIQFPPGKPLSQQEKDSLQKEYISPAASVLAMVEEARNRLKRNAKSLIPK